MARSSGPARRSKGRPASAPAYAIAMRWTALDPEDRTFEAFLSIDMAQSWDEFTGALEVYGAPMQNFVYADVDGNIGYYAPGKLPIRAGGDGRET